MQRSIAAIFAIFSIFNGGTMLFAGPFWYASVPGASETGPYNPHFVQDIGAAFLIAGLDVFDIEPHTPDALTAFPNVVLTPHVGGHTLESHVAMQDCVIANLDAFFAGRALPHPVQGA